MKINKFQLLKISNIAIVIMTIIINALANVLPIGDNYTEELADNIPNLFVPAGVTFAIWGIIYILIILFSVYLARDLFKKEKMTNPFIEKISYFFILANIANIVWILLWHYEQVTLSLFATIVVFGSLLVVYLRLNIGSEKVSIKDKLFVHIPISVYLGWGTVATIANVTAVLVVINWNGFGIGEEIWTMVALIIATIITLLVLFTRKDYAYCFVIIWAFFGIYLKRSVVDPIYGLQSQIAFTALIAIVAIIIFLIIMMVSPYFKKSPIKNSVEI